MKSLFYNAASVEWREVPEPQIEAPTDALVRPVAVSTCDLDQALLERTLPGAETPFAMGHEGVGEIVAVGDGVTGLRVGETAAISYHVSCGACPTCADALPLFCERSAPDTFAVFGIPFGPDFGGLFSDLIRVPFADHTLVPLPDGVSPLDAVSVGDNLSDAHRIVAPHLEHRPGADVLILSTGSIGLFAADIARAYGAGAVLYADPSEERRAIAAEYGAETCRIDELDALQRRFDLTLNNTDDGSGATLRSCLLATKPGGFCESTVFHLRDPEVPLLAMHLNCLTLRSSLSNARNEMPIVLDLIATERIRPQLVPTARLPFDEIADALPTAGFKPVFSRR